MNLKALVSLSVLLLGAPLCADTVPASPQDTPQDTPQDATPELLPMKAVEATALQNHPSMRLAREETEIADLKRLEAKRALWPGLTAKAENTHGEAVEALGTPPFTERSYGLEGTHTLYSGGKLHNTYHQTLATWESFIAKQKKAESDVLYGVREAAWNLIKAQRVSKDLRQNAGGSGS